MLHSGLHKNGLECLCLLGEKTMTQNSSQLASFQETVGSFLSPMLKYWPSIAAYPKAQQGITSLLLPWMAKDLRTVKWGRSCLIIVGKESPLSVVDLAGFIELQMPKYFQDSAGVSRLLLPLPVPLISLVAFPVFSTTRCGTHLRRHIFICCVPPSVEKIELDITFSIYNSTLLLYMTIFVQENKALCLQRLSLLFCIEGLHNKNSLIFKGDHTGVPHACFTFLVTQSLSPQVAEMISLFLYTSCFWNLSVSVFRSI